MAITRQSLLDFLDSLLRPQDFQDYCPNGLQVEGTDTISKVVTGVTASQALIDAAVAQQADAILVHHGYFWKGENPTITGMKGNRIRQLMKHDISLLAYHLPIDAHADYGNNVQLGKLIGAEHLKPLAGLKPEGIVYHGTMPEPCSAQSLIDNLSSALGRELLHEGDKQDVIQSVAWCTGGGQGYIEAVAAAGIDCFITGEVSEQTIHVAREMGIHFIAAGHHATERYGVKAVGEYLAQSMPVEVTFIDIDNPA